MAFHFCANVDLKSARNMSNSYHIPRKHKSFETSKIAFSFNFFNNWLQINSVYFSSAVAKIFPEQRSLCVLQDLSNSTFHAQQIQWQFSYQLSMLVWTKLRSEFKLQGQGQGKSEVKTKRLKWSDNYPGLKAGHSYATDKKALY